MGYKPRHGGYKHRNLIARGKSATKKQRTIIQRIIESGPTREELYQLLTALALITSQIDDTLDDLATYGKEEDP